MKTKIVAALVLITTLIASTNAQAATFDDSCNISFYASKVAVYLKESNKEAASRLLSEIGEIQRQLESTISQEISSGNTPSDCLTLALEELIDAPTAYEKTQQYIAAKSKE